MGATQSVRYWGSWREACVLSAEPGVGGGVGGGSSGSALNLGKPHFLISKSPCVGGWVIPAGEARGVHGPWA